MVTKERVLRGRAQGHGGGIADEEMERLFPRRAFRVYTTPHPKSGTFPRKPPAGWGHCSQRGRVPARCPLFQMTRPCWRAVSVAPLNTRWAGHLARFQFTGLLVKKTVWRRAWSGACCQEFDLMSGVPLRGTVCALQGWRGWEQKQN